MIIFLVKASKLEYNSSTDILFRYNNGTWNDYSLDFLGTLEDLLIEIETNIGISFSNIFNNEFIEVTLPAGITDIEFLDNDFSKFLGFRPSNDLVATKWGTFRFMINNDRLLGHEAQNMRPYEIESNFTLDGRVYKSTPKISTIFYDFKFGDYTKKQVEDGVIPFVENLESNVDVYFNNKSYAFFDGFFNSNVFQINFNTKYLEAGLTLNSNIVKCQLSERPSVYNNGKLIYFLTDSTGAFIINSRDDYTILER